MKKPNPTLIKSINMTHTIVFKIEGQHETHRGTANIVPNKLEGVINAVNNLPGEGELTSRIIGQVDGYDIYENYYDSGSDDYSYFAVKASV